MADILRTPVNDRSAWRPEDFDADDSWIVRLSLAEAEELTRATRTVLSEGMAPFAFSKAQFPLPTLSSRLDAIRDELENGRGFVLMRGVPIDGIDGQAIELMYSGIGAHLGHVITQNSQGDRIGRVTDRGNEYAATGVRGHGSRAEIRPHCDSADVVGLLCVSPAAKGGASVIASAMTVYNELLKHHSGLIETLCRGFQINLAGKGVTGRADELTRQRIPVFSYYHGRLSCRFNQKQTEDAAKILGKPLTELESRAVRAVGELAMRPDIRFPMDFRRGDLQLLNNHCVLHAREAYEDDPSSGRRRLLLRMWVNIPGGRPLAPEFADRLNTGPRGEVAVISGQPPQQASDGAY